ncbi:MAG: metallophosphoesterase [Muribaculaceae bacterium]|nr:metallophosphoesterase [Muribaculaceae bacterium]
MKRYIIASLFCALAVSAVMAGINPSSGHYAAGQNIVIAYDGLPVGAEILIYKGLSLQPMLESQQVTDAAGTIALGNGYEPGTYTVKTLLDGNEVSPSAQFSVADPELARGSAKIVVLSDIHVMAPELLIRDGKAFTDHVATDRKMLRQSAEIFSTMTDSIIRIHPDLVMITGDLTKDGETASHHYVAAELQRLKEAGIPSLVIPGNHDCNNPGAKTFDGDTWAYAPTVTRDEFAQIYSAFGYGDDVVRDPSSLSYATEPLPGLVVLGIDSNEDEENRLVSRGDDSNVSHVAGRIKPATLQWLLERAHEATRANKQVIALLHHHLVPHFDKEETLVSPYVLENAASVQRQLLDAGVRLVFTGHFHVQDVARIFNDEHTDSLTEVSSGALVGYPHPFRTVDFNTDFTQAHLHSGFIHSIASMPDLEAQSQAVLAACVPSLVRTLVNLYWDRVLNKLSDKLGGLDNVRLIMDLPETPAEAAALVNEYLGDAARRSYMLLTEGNEHLKRTDDLMEAINTGLDGIINALVKPLFRAAVSGLLRVEIEERFGAVFTSVYHDVNNVGTPGECEVNDLYLDLELPRPTAIERVTSDGAAAQAVDYYDITGRRMSEPQRGVNIVVTQYSNGVTQAVKTVN